MNNYELNNQSLLSDKNSQNSLFTTASRMIIVHPTTILICNGGILPAETDSLGNKYIQHTFPMYPHHHNSRAAIHHRDMHTLNNHHMHVETFAGPLL
jgi:hypothetical protein